jgi:divalent metal cation (Fe/Co/Zn/Cd) transporter
LSSVARRDPIIVDEIEHVTGHVDGVQGVGSVHGRWIGHRLATSISIVVDHDLSVRQGDDVAEAVRHQLLHTVAQLDDVDVHVDPSGRHDAEDPQALTGHHRLEAAAAT